MQSLSILPLSILNLFMQSESYPIAYPKIVKINTPIDRNCQASGSLNCNIHDQGDRKSIMYITPLSKLSANTNRIDWLLAICRSQNPNKGNEPQYSGYNYSHTSQRYEYLKNYMIALLLMMKIGLGNWIITISRAMADWIITKKIWVYLSPRALVLR